MKLAKKMLVCLMALVMVAIIGISASASSITVASTDIAVGETATVEVTAADFAGAYSGNLTINYNADVLKYVDSTSAVGVAGCPEAGQVTIAFMYMNAATDSSAVLATITFEAIAEGDANISVSIDSWDGEGAADAASTSASAGKIEVVPAAAETTTKAPETTTKAPETTTKAAETTTKAAETTTKAAPETTTKDNGGLQPADDESEATSTIIINPDKGGKGSKDAKGGMDAKDAKAIKKVADKKVCKVAQTGDAAVAVIAGIMAIGAVGFIATKKRDF